MLELRRFGVSRCWLTMMYRSDISGYLVACRDLLVSCVFDYSNRLFMWIRCLSWTDLHVFKPVVQLSVKVLFHFISATVGKGGSPGTCVTSEFWANLILCRRHAFFVFPNTPRTISATKYDSVILQASTPFRSNDQFYSNWLKREDFFYLFKKKSKKVKKFVPHAAYCR